MRAMRIAAAVLTGALFSLGDALAAPPERALMAFNEFAEATGAPGVSITVVENGEIVWDQATGMSDLEQGSPMTTGTLMRIGSISKTMTAVAAMRMASQGLIDLDEPVSDYLKDYKGPARKSSLRQLASHTGCVRGYREGEGIVYTHYESAREALTLFESDPLECSPGEEFIYSSYGFTLLSAVMAEVEKTSFYDVMQTEVWESAGLTQTDFDDVFRIIKGRARFYETDDKGALVNAPYNDSSYKYAGAGMLSSTRDMAHFGAALLDGDLLAADEQRDLFTAQQLTGGGRTAYGLGWYVDFEKFLADRRDKIPAPLYESLMRQVEGRRIVWHSGTMEGAVAILMMEPEKGRVLALAMNKGGVEKEAIVAALGLMTLLDPAFR